MKDVSLRASERAAEAAARPEEVVPLAEEGPASGVRERD